MDEDVARYFFKQLLAAIRYWCVHTRTGQTGTR
jgi:hypothetical protein